MPYSIIRSNRIQLPVYNSNNYYAPQSTAPAKAPTPQPQANVTMPSCINELNPIGSLKFG